MKNENPTNAAPFDEASLQIARAESSLTSAYFTLPHGPERRALGRAVGAVREALGRVLNGSIQAAWAASKS
jgi:hypothetical protein